MKRLKSNIVLHLLVALALSLVINFSYLLIPIITDYGMNQRGDDSVVGEHNMGELHIEPDLHGYIICDCSASDSTYVSSWQVRTHKLQDGDLDNFSPDAIAEMKSACAYRQAKMERLYQLSFDLGV